MQTIKTIGEPLLDKGYEPLPISPGSKVPHIPNWSMLEIDRQLVQKWAANGKADNYVGLRCGHTVAIDVDIDHPDVTQALLDDLEWSLGGGPVRYGKPGRALVIFRSATLWPKKSIRLLAPDGSTHAVEVLAKGQQFVAYGVHESTGKPYRWEGGEPATVSAGELVEVTESAVVEWLAGVADLLPDGWAVVDSRAFDEEERFLLQYRPPRDESEMAPEELLEHRALGELGAWVPEMLPAAREYQGGYRITSKALGRDLQEDLQLLPSGIYDFGEEQGASAVGTVAKWRFDGDTDAAKAWLCERLGVDLERQAKAVEERRAEEEPVTMWQQRIDSAPGVPALQRLADAIGRDGRLSEIDRELLVGSWQAKFKGVNGSPIPVATVRKALAYSGKAKGRAAEDRPEWCEGWYYVTHTDSFFRYGTTQWVSMQGFNALYQRETDPDDDGRRPPATRLALDDYHLPVVEVGIYAPHLGERFELSGRECVNTFMPGSIPAPDSTVDEDGRQAIDTLDRHLWAICGGRERIYTALLDWLTWVVQNPGRKVRYAPIIKGIEGDGKSLLLQLLAICLGQANVRSVMPQVLMSQFNGYAEGVCVVGLEEIRMSGHNRHDATNAVKPLITNDTIDIHKKGQDSYNALNTANYIAFTNHSDAIPVSQSDRRWLVIFTPWHDLAEMQKVVGMQADQYFTRLHNALNDHGGALRYWLAGRTVSATFNPNGPAPATAEKDSMRAADMDDAEEMIADALKAGGLGFSETVLSTKHLTDHLVSAEFDDGGAYVEVPQGRSLAKLLQRLGWSRVPKQVKWDGVACRVWVKGSVDRDNAEIREQLEATRWVTVVSGEGQQGEAPF